MLIDLFEKHMFARRFALFWSMGLITYTVVGFFEHFDSVGGSQLAFMTAVIGILTTVVNFYGKYRGEKDDI
jgi:hypothetical protein